MILAQILNTKITKNDDIEEMMEKIYDTIAKFKLKYNLQWDEWQIRTLNDLIKNKWWKFVTDKQRAFFKANILRRWESFDSSKNAFMTPMVNYKVATDIWVMYSIEWYKTDRRNKKFTYFFIDEKWIRLAVEHVWEYKVTSKKDNSWFSKERYHHTRARRNDMNSWIESWSENIFWSEKVIFRRGK